MKRTQLLIVGYSAENHIGSHFQRGAQQMNNVEAMLIDPSPAFHTPRWVEIVNWRLRGKRPSRLSAFSRDLVSFCRAHKPEILLVTGITPPDATALQEIRRLGITTVNYLTDDPWNSSHQSTWFLNALTCYDLICSPRRSNLADLESAGCQAAWVPFGYEPSIHFPELPPSELQAQFTCDVLFYGGADQDRVPLIEALIQSGTLLHLYGGYWNRYSTTKPYHKGMADPQMLRWAVSSAKITLCMVRRANRDGHVMRSYEVPAMKGCMLVEDTEEHRTIFDPEGDHVLYFKDVNELVGKTSCLLTDSVLRQKLSTNAHHHIASHPNTYHDRLAQILALAQNLPT